MRATKGIHNGIRIYVVIAGLYHRRASVAFKGSSCPLPYLRILSLPTKRGLSKLRLSTDAVRGHALMPFQSGYQLRIVREGWGLQKPDAKPDAKPHRRDRRRLSSPVSSFYTTSCSPCPDLSPLGRRPGDLALCAWLPGPGRAAAHCPRADWSKETALRTIATTYASQAWTWDRGRPV